MPSPIQSQSTTRAGLCPHGLPPSACPICNSGAMGGGIRVKDTPATKPAKTNEWSWIKCYAAGLAMRANEARAENAKNAFEKQIEFAKQLKNNIQQIADRIKNAIDSLQKTLPSTIGKVVSIISNAIIFPILNIIAQIPKLIEKFAQLQQNIANLVKQTGDKITAFLSDFKNFIEKTFIEKTKKAVKKFFLFFISDPEDENYQNDDTLAVFKSRELRKLLSGIINPKKEEKENADRSIKSK